MVYIQKPRGGAPTTAEIAQTAATTPAANNAQATAATLDPNIERQSTILATSLAERARSDSPDDALAFVSTRDRGERLRELTSELLPDKKVTLRQEPSGLYSVCVGDRTLFESIFGKN